jgi:hypothetical protein
MIDQEELAICRRRGHNLGDAGIAEGWKPCKSCGTWVREVRTIEERADDPPEAEIDPLTKVLRHARQAVDMARAPRGF